jgi:hypothetical protein
VGNRTSLLPKSQCPIFTRISDVPVIDPDIDPLHQMLRRQHVVITQENDVLARFGSPDEMDPLLDHSLSRLIGRVSLAGDN